MMNITVRAGLRRFMTVAVATLGITAIAGCGQKPVAGTAKAPTPAAAKFHLEEATIASIQGALESSPTADGFRSATG